jgi:hypothetical protein
MEDALAVMTLFIITVRCADTFQFAMLDDRELEKSARRLLAKGMHSAWRRRRRIRIMFRLRMLCDGGFWRGRG